MKQGVAWLLLLLLLPGQQWLVRPVRPAAACQDLVVVAAA
jgi:hypothetical protein